MPIIKAPRFFKIPEDSTKLLEVNLSHPDSNQTMVQLEILCENGSTRLNYPDGLTFIDGTSNNGAYISAIGIIQTFQKSLNQLAFLPNENWNTKGKKFDKIVISVKNNSQRGLIDKNTTHVVTVDVEEVNDPPQWNIPGSELCLQPIGGYIVESVATIDVFEDDTIKISPISIADVDAHKDSPDFSLTISIKAGNGYLRLAKYNSLFTGTSNQMHIQFTGTFSSVNAALRLKVLNIYSIAKKKIHFQ
jgi:hypothetical protein